MGHARTRRGTYSVPQGSGHEMCVNKLIMCDDKAAIQTAVVRLIETHTYHITAMYKEHTCNNTIILHKQETSQNKAQSC